MHTKVKIVYFGPYIIITKSCSLFAMISVKSWTKLTWVEKLNFNESYGFHANVPFRYPSKKAEVF